MTCKDCYHYDACKEKFAGLYKISVEKPKKHFELNPQVENRCQQFKDKSQIIIIELPMRATDELKEELTKYCYERCVDEL